MLRKLLLPATAAVFALAGWRLYGPKAIDPLAWQAPEAPKLEGVYAPNAALAALQRLGDGIGDGPEGLAFDAQGRLLSGLLDGSLIRASADGAQVEVLAHTGGRPLGLAVDADGSLLVPDAVKGLLRLKPDGQLETLLSTVDGQPLRFANVVVRGPKSGALYLSDSSTRHPFPDYFRDLLEHRGAGRVIRFDPNTGEARTLADGLNFANGLVVDPDEQWLLVAETSAYRIDRIWLAGERAGQREVFVDNLPGFPDNLSYNGRDRIWIALPGERDAEIDALASRPFLRRAIAALPNRIQMRLMASRTSRAWVLAVDLDGQVVANLQDAGANAYRPITSVVEQGEWLYVGSLSAKSVARLPLASVLPNAAPGSAPAAGVAPEATPAR